MKAAVVTVSDGCARGVREDLSGQALRRLLKAHGWGVAASTVVPDEVARIRQVMLKYTQLPNSWLIVTTGGTGIASRDVTPEAVRPLLEKELPGLAELMRLRGLEKTPLASLSRSLAGVRNRCLILCLPGSVAGAAESLEAVLAVVPHALELLQGQTEHRVTKPGGPPEPGKE